MPVFFAQNRGQVVRVGGRDVLSPSPVGVRVGNFGLGNSQLGFFGNPANSLIVTQIGRNDSVNVQVQHAADETIYAYIFGNRIGELRLGGTCFSRPCNLGLSSDIPVESGPAQLFRIYQAARASTTGLTVLVSIGPTVIRTLLVGMAFELTDPETELSQWGLKFIALAGANP